MLREIVIDQFKNSAGKVQDIRLSYQIFGKNSTEAPVILVNHALTGNSEVTGEFGWWKELIGEGKCIDLRRYCVLAINIPGNGYKGNEVFKEFKDFKLTDIARLQAQVLERLNIGRLFAIIGGSIGGALAWELAVIKPALADHIIPIATDYKATDWLVANCRIQEQILNNSSNPVHDARMHAMTFYRTPQSLAEKFENKKSEGQQIFEVENWLLHHGEKLKNRFTLDSYKFMNHLLTTIDISGGNGGHIQYARQIKGHIHIVTVNSDLFFLADENRRAYKGLSLFKPEVSYYEIDSIHGHDAFLIETDQLVSFLNPIFQFQEAENFKVTLEKSKVLSSK